MLGKSGRGGARKGAGRKGKNYVSMSVRLPEETRNRITRLSIKLGITLGETIAQAVDKTTETKEADPLWQRRVSSCYLILPVNLVAKSTSTHDMRSFGLSLLMMISRYIFQALPCRDVTLLKCIPSCDPISTYLTLPLRLLSVGA